MLDNIAAQTDRYNWVDSTRQVICSLDLSSDFHALSKDFVNNFADLGYCSFVSLWEKKSAEFPPDEGWQVLDYRCHSPSAKIDYQQLVNRSSLRTGDWVLYHDLQKEGPIMLLALTHDIMLMMGLKLEQTQVGFKKKKAFVNCLLFFGKILANKKALMDTEKELKKLEHLENKYQQLKNETQEKEKLFLLVSENTKDLLILHQPN